MAKEQPLYLRLYREEPLYELARLVGYQGLPMPEAQEKIKPLIGKHGKQTMADAAERIVRIDPSTNPPTARLTDEARKACWQLLGPPPEHPEYERFHSPEPWCPPWRQPAGSPPFALPDSGDGKKATEPEATPKKRRKAT